MTNNPARTNGSAAWRAAARLVLVLFALRALVPIGFMPDFGAAGDRRFEIVVCTPAGAKSILVGADGQPVDPDADQPGKADPAGDRGCPFFKTIAQPFAAPSLALLGDAADPAPPPGFFADDLFRQPPPLGPPLGSRAPPLRLA